jgi:hypothetical protein
MLLAAQATHRRVVQRQQIAALKVQRTADDARRRWHQAQHGEARHRLAAARLANQTQRLARADGEVDAVDRGRDAGLCEEMHLQSVDREQVGHCFNRGLKASDKAVGQQVESQHGDEDRRPGARTAQGETFST